VSGQGAGGAASDGGKVVTLVLSATAAGAVQHAVAILRHGGLVSFPTDTVYGLGARASDSVAVSRLYVAKQRPADKAIPLLVSSVDELLPNRGWTSAGLPPAGRRLAELFWPGPLTLVVSRGPRVSDIVAAGGDSVAVRIPDHPLVLSLLESLAEPLATTSANLSGWPSPLTAAEVMDQLAGSITMVLDGGPCPGGLASTVVDVSGRLPEIVRQGPISEQVIWSSLAGLV
jgi:L-threonylcarbamoyladenylate synthase